MIDDSTTFNQRFDQYGQWREQAAGELKNFTHWLEQETLADVATLERLQWLQDRVFAGKITVAFVAEFSRGKSELINALFFADYGRRIIPASPGRTTKCPTELTWQEGQSPSIRLLPIETRKQTISLNEWRNKKSAWTKVALNTKCADSLSDAIAKVTETILVDREDARQLGFSDVNDPALRDYSDMVEVPKWRHAIINFPHPLLKKGLVIVDTPGFNAVGAEPELTVSLLSQAQATLFLLSADTGASRSDLEIWQQQICNQVNANNISLVILNKIDTLWDELSSKTEQAKLISQQRRNVAKTLGTPLNRVLAVSAKQALVAKINHKADLLKASAIGQLESVLIQSLLEQRHQILREAFVGVLTTIHDQAQQVLNMRKRGINEQALEILSLQGSNAKAMLSVKTRIARERNAFDECLLSVDAFNVRYSEDLNEVFALLSGKAVKAEIKELAHEVQQRVFALGAQKRYAHMFANLHKALQAAQLSIDLMHQTLAQTYAQLNADFQFSLQPPAKLDLQQFEEDLNNIEKSNQHFFSITNSIKMNTVEFSEMLINAIAMRLRTVFEMASNELALWEKSCSAQLELQLRDRKNNLAIRSQTIERITQADMDLNQLLKDLDEQLSALRKTEAELSRKEKTLITLVDAASQSIHQQAQPAKK